MKKFYEMLCKIEMGVAMSFLSISVLAIFTSAVMRVMKFPISWGLDIALLLFTWSTFLGADIAFKKKCLVSVDMLVIRLPKPIRKILEAVVYMLILAAIVFLIYYGVRLTYFSWARPFQAIPGLSYSWVTLSVPVSMFLMLISALIQIYDVYFKKNDDKGE
ncbi:MAG: TRAP transporter small permease [Synergistaceae bacterium]|nr:TRAP transporter small permease [Synergistaceae bacterium]